MQVPSIICSIIFLLTFSLSTNANTLELVKKQDALHCGTNADGLGFGAPGKTGVHSGIGVDLCRAIAKAVLGDSNKARVYPVLSRDRIAFTASGNYQVLISTLEWTMYRDSFLGVKFVSPWFYDGQVIAMRKKDNIKSIKDIDGSTICVTQGANTEITLGDVARINKIKIQPIVFGDPNQAIAAFGQGRCDGYSSDSYLLTGNLLKINLDINEVTVLNLEVEQKTYGALIKANDSEWENAVKWIINTLIHAESMGVTKDNVEQLAQTSTNPDIRRLLQVEGEFYKKLGLNQNFAVELIKEFGNYGDLYNKNFGQNNIHGVTFPARTHNRLCKNGGRICALTIF